MKEINFFYLIKYNLLSSIDDVLLIVIERFIGGNGGLVRLDTPTVELNGVRGLVN